MVSFQKIVEWLLNLMKTLAGITLAGMVIITCVDVTARYFGRPIRGSIEIVGILAVLTTVFALPYTHKMKAHIGVEMFVQMLSPKTQVVIDLCTSILSFLLFAIVTWRMMIYAYTIQKSGEVTMNLNLPEYYIIYIAACCFLVFSLLILLEIIQLIKRVKTG